MAKFVIAIDQGTTSSRAIIFDSAMTFVSSAQQEFTQHYPESGWVEHDPEEIWSSVVATVRAALDKASLTTADIGAIGITNQRETVVVWERDTGRPIHNAIVWQDRRTASRCRELAAKNVEDDLRARTGLLIDPYFSATKIAWILDEVEGARERAGRGELVFGTVDTYLVWR